MKIGRNDPCPCGSGRKYKKCCLAGRPSAESPSRPSPRFRFEPGSYGKPGYFYVPSAVCYEQVSPGQWREHFCLVNPTRRFDGEDQAADRAEQDLNDAALLRAARGSDADFALSLREQGYVSLDGFQNAKNEGFLRAPRHPRRS